MSGTSHDDGLSTAKSPPGPWKFIFIAFLCFCGLAFIFLAFKSSGYLHQHAEKPPQATDVSHADAYQGPPDLKENAAFRASSPPAPKPQPPPPIDESSVWAGKTVWTPQGLQQPLQQPGATPQENPQTQGGGAGQGDSLLHGTTVAYKIPHPMFTVPEGKVISCKQITKLSTASGGNVLVTAIVDEDVWGIGNQVILMNKGTEVIGEVAHGMINGLDRLQVVWRRGRTPPPYNVRFTLDAPAAGPLGEGGLDGDINRHEWQKIKGVLLFTLLDWGGAIAQSALAARGTTSINLGSTNTQSTAEAAGTILLQSMINIPDTITRNQGKSCSIFMAGDVDFSNVYGLKEVRK